MKKTKIIVCILSALSMVVGLFPTVSAEDFYINYSEASASGDLYGYLEDRLSETDTALSSSDIADIADYIEFACETSAFVRVNASDNVAVADGNKIAEKYAETLGIIQEYETLLAARGISLNRDLVAEVPVLIYGFTPTVGSELSVDKNTVNAMADVESVRFILDDTNDFVSLSGAELAQIANILGEFRFSIKEAAETYTIRFLDRSGNVAEELPASVKIGLPCGNPECTVYYFDGSEQENWGGQYNAADRLIEFSTKYSGEYTVTLPEVDINDIDGLSEYEKQAIRFMTVRNYYTLENGRFRPEETLTRYQFTEALVRMFYALDDDAQCSFSDVASNDPNYSYVAASYESSIVEGFPDGTFRGNDNVTAEQVIALASRTINEKCGYEYPTDNSAYISFAESSTIGEWAESELALAVREGIAEPGATEDYSAEISRKDSAVILYRLFMIMNNTPQASVASALRYSESSHSSFFTTQNTWIVIGTAAFVDVCVIAAAVIILLLKKKNIAK